MTGRIEEAVSKLTNKCERASAYICFYLDEGKITGINGLEEIKSLPEVMKADVENLHVGDVIAKMEHKGMRKGPFIVCADSLAELNVLIHKIQLYFSIDINGGYGIKWK